MSVEGKEDTLPGIISFIWKGGCARSKSHCKREIASFPDEALCLLHNTNSNVSCRGLNRQSCLPVGTEVLSTIRRLWVLMVPIDLIHNFSQSLGLYIYSVCHKSWYLSASPELCVVNIIRDCYSKYWRQNKVKEN